MANTAHPVTGPTLTCNETLIPDMGGAGAIKAAGAVKRATYPSKDQGRFVGGEPSVNDMPGEPFALRKSYPKHGGEIAEIHGSLKTKFNGGKP